MKLMATAPFISIHYHKIHSALSIRVVRHRGRSPPPS